MIEAQPVVVPLRGGPPGKRGFQGEHGEGLQLDEVVSNHASLPSGKPAKYVVYATDNGHAYWYSGSAWIDLGDITGPAGVGMPAGGTTGQMARKKSGTAYDVEWHTLVAADVTDATTVGKAVMTAASKIAAAQAIDALRTLGPTALTGIWLGTKAQYDAIATPDDQVAYIVTED